MLFVEPKAELIVENNPYKKIELAGRTCYKSENKITEDSAPKFTRGLIKSNHTAMVEHHTFCFEISNAPNAPLFELSDFRDALRKCKYLNVTDVPVRGTMRCLVSGNVRALNEAFVFSPYATAPLLRALRDEYPDLVYATPTKAIDGFWQYIIADIVAIEDLPSLSIEEIETHKYLTYRLICDRGVTHEIVRHRPASYAQESSRYCNYSGGLSVIVPEGFDGKERAVQMVYESAFWQAENAYQKLIDMGEKPEQARAVLPTAVKTELVMTANLKELAHFFRLRKFGTTGRPHPDMKQLADMMYAEAKDNDPLFKWWATEVFGETEE